MNNKLAVYSLLILCVVVGGYFVLHSSDEQQIKKNLALLAEYCSTTAQEPLLETMQKISQAAKLCRDPCEVKIPSFSIDREFTQQEFSQHLMLLKKQLPTTRFNFTDTSIIMPGEDSAAITTTVQLKGTNAAGRFADVYELDIGAEKIDGNWLFTSFHVVEFIEK